MMSCLVVLTYSACALLFWGIMDKVCASKYRVLQRHGVQQRNRNEARMPLCSVGQYIQAAFMFFHDFTGTANLGRLKCWVPETQKFVSGKCIGLT